MIVTRYNQVEKSRETMTRKEAVLAMLDGKKITSPSLNDAYLFFDDGGFSFFDMRSRCSSTIQSSLRPEYGYELYEEPKSDYIETEITLNGEKLYRKVK